MHPSPGQHDILKVLTRMKVLPTRGPGSSDGGCRKPHLGAEFFVFYHSVVVFVIHLGAALRRQWNVIIRMKVLLSRCLRGAPRGCRTSCRGAGRASHTWGLISVPLRRGTSSLMKCVRRLIHDALMRGNGALLECTCFQKTHAKCKNPRSLCQNATNLCLAKSMHAFR